MSLECSACEGDLRGHDAACPRTSAGLDNVPIGLDCEHCGKPLTVNYMAHGTSGEALVSDALLDLVKAAGRAIFKDRVVLCEECSPPRT